MDVKKIPVPWTLYVITDDMDDQEIEKIVQLLRDDHDNDKRTEDTSDSAIRITENAHKKGGVAYDWYEYDFLTVYLAPEAVSSIIEKGVYLLVDLVNTEEYKHEVLIRPFNMAYVPYISEGFIYCRHVRSLTDEDREIIKGWNGNHHWCCQHQRGAIHVLEQTSPLRTVVEQERMMLNNKH